MALNFRPFIYVVIFLTLLISEANLFGFQAEISNQNSPKSILESIEEVIATPKKEAIELGRKGIPSPKPAAPDISLKELEEVASHQISALSRVKKTINKKELMPTWNLMMQIHRHPDKNSNDVFKALFKRLSRLELPPSESLTVYRVLGQDAYFNGKNKTAEKYFNLAFNLFAKAKEDEKESLSFSMGNIIYLNGLVLSETDASPEVVRENDELLVNEPLLWSRAPAETRIDILLRLGNSNLADKRFGEAEKCYAKGLELAKLKRQTDLSYRLDFELGLVEVHRNVGVLDEKQVILTLVELKDKLRGKQYSNYDHLIVALIKHSKEGGDENKVIELVTELNDFYLSPIKSGDSSHFVRTKYLKSASGLINLHLHRQESADAKRVLEEVVEFGEPSESWFNSIPEEFSTNARMNSIVVPTKESRNDK
jgi:tetratricopeptide (TPR) repeat protein